MTTHEEVAKVLRQYIAGEVTGDDLSHLNWFLVNEPTVNIGGWEITLFIEARWIYDIYDATSPDGRKFEFTPSSYTTSSIDLFLTRDEVDALCEKLGCPI